MTGGAGTLPDAICWCWRLAALALLLAAAPTPAVQIVAYGRPSADIDREASYPVDLLQLALSRSGGDYRLQPSTEVIPQSRAIALLRSNQVIDVLWTVTSPERERLLLPVRIPIDRGIYGWRLFLIHADAQPRFDAVSDLAGLAGLTAGQGHDWPDLTILRAGGLKVAAGSSYDGLFEMLARQRIDYYPRALPEVWVELQQRRHLPLSVESTLALHYPSAMYFFVSPDDPQLAAALELGLETAITDGSFQQLFDRYFGAAIARARLSERTILEIDNPLLPDLARSDPRYWFNLMADR